MRYYSLLCALMDYRLCTNVQFNLLLFKIGIADYVMYHLYICLYVVILRFSVNILLDRPKLSSLNIQNFPGFFLKSQYTKALNIIIIDNVDHLFLTQSCYVIFWIYFYGIVHGILMAFLIDKPLIEENLNFNTDDFCRSSSLTVYFAALKQ